MKRMRTKKSRHYTFGGNIFRLIHGVVILDAVFTWNKSLALVEDIVHEIFGLIRLVLAVATLLLTILIAPVRPIFTIFKALWLLRLRKIATIDNMPEDMYLWNAKDGCFKYDNSQRTNLDAGLYFLPNKRDKHIIEQLKKQAKDLLKAQEEK